MSSSILSHRLTSNSVYSFSHKLDCTNRSFTHLWSTGQMQSTRPIYAALHPTFKMFSLPFDVDREELLLQLEMELIDLQCWEDFLAYHILDFYKNHELSSGWFPTYTQLKVSMFGTTDQNETWQNYAVFTTALSSLVR